MDVKCLIFLWHEVIKKREQILSLFIHLSLSLELTVVSGDPQPRTTSLTPASVLHASPSS